MGAEGSPRGGRKAGGGAGGAAKRTLRRDSHDMLLLIVPFIVWAALVSRAHAEHLYEWICPRAARGAEVWVLHAHVAGKARLLAAASVVRACCNTTQHHPWRGAEFCTWILHWMSQLVRDMPPRRARMQMRLCLCACMPAGHHDLHAAVH